MRRLKRRNRRAYDAAAGGFALRGLLAVLGLMAAVFMGVLCLRRHEPGAALMMLVLDAAEAAALCLLLLVHLRLRRRSRRMLPLGGAVARGADGPVCVSYVAAGVCYTLRLPQRGRVPESGMADLWYDPKRPALVQIG